MNIALSATVDDEYSVYIAQLLQNIAENSKYHSFYFIGNNIIPADDLPQHIIPATISKSLINSLFAEKTFNTQLQKWNIEKFISYPTGINITNTSTIIYASEKLLSNKKKQKKIALQLNSTALILVPDNSVKEYLIENYKTDKDKITILPLAADEIFYPRDYDDCQAVKSSYADNREYFFVHWSGENLDRFINILKSFSIFKKWQRSNMKMMIAGTLPADAGEKLKTYKLRDDIVIVGEQNDKQFAKLLGCAYAFINTSTDITDVLQAMQSEVAVITTNNKAAELFPNAMQLAENETPERLSAAMIELYKDEMRKADLVRTAITFLHKKEETTAKLEGILKL